MRRELLSRCLRVFLALILCIEALMPFHARAADEHFPGTASGSMTAETVQAWTMDALDRGAVQALLNRQTLRPQRTGWVELDNKIGELLSHAGSSAYDRLWYAYDWLVKNITYSWAGYTTAQLPGHYYDRFEWDYLKNLTYEPGLRKSVPDDMANRAYHVLTAKKGVCYDFAITIAVIARYIGLESYVHLGDFQWEYEDKDTSYHGWAVLVLDGGKYVFDAQRDSRYWSEYKKNPGYYFGIPEAKAWRYAPNKYEEDRIGNAKRDAQMLPLTAARKTQFTITVKSSGSGTVSGGGKYDAGTPVSLRATPAFGRSFEGWYKYDGTKISGSNPYTITAGADRTYTALFSGDYFRQRQRFSGALRWKRHIQPGHGRDTDCADGGRQRQCRTEGAFYRCAFRGVVCELCKLGLCERSLFGRKQNRICSGHSHHAAGIHDNAGALYCSPGNPGHRKRSPLPGRGQYSRVGACFRGAVLCTGAGQG